MSDLLKALNGHPYHSHPMGSVAGMVATTTMIVAITLQIGW